MSRGGVETYSNGYKHVLGEENALEFDDKKVYKLMNITNNRIQSRLGHREVPLGSELRRQALTKDKVAKNLSCNSNPQSHPCDFEGVSQNVEVPGSEDEEDGCHKRNARGARVIP